MAQQVRAVVARAVKQPVTVEMIEVPDPGPGRGARAGAGLRRVPHRPPLPGGRHQRRLPVPARPRGGRAWSRPSGPGVTDVAPGRLRDPQLAGRVRRVPVVPPGPPLVLLLHAQRHAEDDPRRRGAVAGARASAPSPRRRSWPPGSARRCRPTVKPEVAGLLGCGVMAGLGAAMHTGEVGPGDSVAVFGCGGVGDAAIAGAALAGATTIIAVDLDARKLELAKRVRRHPHRRRVQGRPGRGHPGAHRRQRRRRVHRGRRQPEGVRAGVLRPRPGRHRGAGGRAQPGDAHRAADDRLLRPGRPPQAELVRRLPPEPRLPAARRPAPAGPPAARAVRVPRRSASTASRRPSTRWSAARCSAPSWCF